MRQSIVGVFDRQDAAREAVEALARGGFGRDRIHVTESHPTATAAVVAAPPVRDDGVIGHLRHFFNGLFGSEPDVSGYADAVRGGGAVVKVDVDDSALAPRAELALVNAGARDITHRTLADAPAAAPVAAPSSARETPVPLDAGDAAMGIPPNDVVSDPAFEPWDDQFRADYQARFAGLGGAYEDYRPAYRYGHGLARDARWQGRPWDDAEPDLRRDWESTHATHVWADVKDAVRHAWESATR